MLLSHNDFPSLPLNSSPSTQEYEELFQALLNASEPLGVKGEKTYFILGLDEKTLELWNLFGTNPPPHFLKKGCFYAHD